MWSYIGEEPCPSRKASSGRIDLYYYLLRECDLIHFIVKDIQTSVLLQRLAIHMKQCDTFRPGGNKSG